MPCRTVSGGHKSASITRDWTDRSAGGIDLATEVQELTWDFFDGEATDRQIGRLEELLSASAEARRVYVMCAQLHADLCLLLGDKTPLPPTAGEEDTQVTAGSAVWAANP